MNTVEDIKKQLQAQFEMIKRHDGICHKAKEMKKDRKEKERSENNRKILKAQRKLKRVRKIKQKTKLKKD